RRQKAIPPPRDRLDIYRPVAVVVQRGPNLLDALVQTVVEVNVGLLAPNLLLNIFPGNKLARTARQEGEDLKGLGRQLKRKTVFAQLFAVEIQLEHPEAKKFLSGSQYHP